MDCYSRKLNKVSTEQIKAKFMKIHTQESQTENNKKVPEFLSLSRKYGEKGLNFPLSDFVH